MNLIDSAIGEIKILEPTVHGDDRGFFYESFHQKRFDQAIGRHVTFVQDNHSRSLKRVLRGLHYQLPPHPLGKLVRCIVGEIFDVAVDLRQGSPTLGQSIGIFLSAANRRQIWIPEGFAHGFLVVSEFAEIHYKTTDYWFKDLERTIQWNDPELAIPWPIQQDLILSEKDRRGTPFSSAEYFP
jgi:dTDP-4-dehydrorhamnose 3,5-epimerase